MKTPASAAVSPTVGANCRRLVTTGTMGRFMMGANWVAVDTGGGKTCFDSTHEEHKHTSIYPASGLTEGDNTPTAALRCISMVTRTTMVLPSLSLSLSRGGRNLLGVLGGNEERKSPSPPLGYRDTLYIAVSQHTLDTRHTTQNTAVKPALVSWSPLLGTKPLRS